MKRIQRQRTKGWRMPPLAAYVGRPSRWGNPFRRPRPVIGPPLPAEDVVAWFRGWATARAKAQPDWLLPLRGRDLVCWCPLDQPCHADVLLELSA